MDSDWSGLPRDLVDLIVNRFVFVSDYIRFGAVCKAWHSVATEKINNLLPPQLPMLIVPSDAQHIWNAYSIKDNKFLPLQFMIPCTNRIVGSSNGWLVTIDEDFVVRLLNPLYLVPEKHTSQNACITLPPLTSFLGVITKAVLSANPTSSPGEYIVMVLYDYGSYSAFIRPSRDKAWTYVNSGWIDLYDAIYYQDKFYAIDSTASVFSFDVSLKSWLPLNPDATTELRAPIMKRRLTESNTGELLLVERVIEKIGSHYTIGANVKKLYKTFEGWKWIEMKNIGDCAMFIGSNNSALSVVASDFCGCQSNSIYTAGDYAYLYSTERQRDLELGVYNMESRSYTPLYMESRSYTPVDVESVENSPIWIVPSF